MIAEPAAPRAGHRGEIVALQLVVGLFLALRLYYDLRADLFGDEAYYWMWGQRLGWSYFDHPPLHAWLLRPVSAIAGWHVFSVRLLTWVTLGGVLLIFRHWSRLLSPETPSLAFWRTTAIYLASPIFFGMTMIAYNDHLLVALSLLAIHCFVVFSTRHATAAPHATRWLYFAAVALGLALLTKYNAIFVGLGFAALFLFDRNLRPLLKTPHPWLAGLLAIAMQAPVVWWNLTEGLASFRYHLDDRWQGDAWQIHPMHPVNFLLLTFVVWSPFLIWPLVRMIRAPALSPFEGAAKRLVVTIFAISTISLVAISLVLDAYYYWNIVAFVGLMPLLVRFMGNPWLRWSHIVFGLVAAGLIVTNFSITPIGNAIGRRDNGSSINYGWTEIADHMRAVEAKAPADLVAATRYSTTSQLGFALGTTEAVKISPEHSQYDYWQDDTSYAGKSALILVDEADKSPVLLYLKAHFANLKQVDAFNIDRFGKTLYRWRIFRGEGYTP